MWLRVDENTDVLVSLSECLHCVRRVREESAFWKWAILSLHNALQGAMVCHLSGTAQLGALSEKSVGAWLTWHDRDGRGEINRVADGSDEFGFPKFKFVTDDDCPPRDHLADSKTLFKRLSSERKRREGGAGAVLEITDSQRDSFRRLNNLRNDFSHFTPKGWSIELAGLPRIFIDAVDVIELIAADPWPFRHMDEEDRAGMDELLRQLRAELDALAAATAGPA
jgi:hypothetical protein